MQPLSILSASIEHPLKHAGDKVENGHFFDARLIVGRKEESLHAAWATDALRPSQHEQRRMGKAANDIRLKKKKKKKKMETAS